MDCIFCAIAAREAPSKMIYEDDRCCAFYDINPQTDVHFLVISKEHIPSAASLGEEHALLVGHIYAVIATLTGELGCTDFRVITNSGKGAGQTVPHLHFHVLSGPGLSATLV